MTPHPPKPRFALRVGITGHRPNKLPRPAMPRIDRQLREVFAAVESAAQAIHADNPDAYDSGPPPEAPRTGPAEGGKPYSIRLISGFAEGADQMAVAACPPDWTIEATLPFPKDEYLKDFAQSAAGDGRDMRDEFLASLAKAAVVTELPAPGNGDRSRAYLAAGSFILRQIDLLVAVWDGEPPQPGGTGAVVRQAREGDIPVVWLSTVADLPPQLIEALDDERPVVAKEECNSTTLRRALEPILAAPGGPNADGASPRAGLERFDGETWQPVCRMGYYDMLKRWACGTRPWRRRIEAAPFDTSLANFGKLVDDGPRAGSLNQRLKDVLGPRHVWADALAVHFSHNYRSVYVVAYLLSALAVLFALGGAFVATIHQKAVVVALELAVVAGIVLLVWQGRRRGWHERWLEYRAVAEGLRHGRFLAFVSEFGHIRHVAGPEQPWTIWYIRATMREIGLPHATLDEAYQRLLLQATRDHEVRDQIGYHRDNAHAMAEVDHLLHRAGNLCFLITMWMLIGFLVVYGAYLTLTLIWPAPRIAGLLYGLLSIAKSGMIVFAAGLPALGAALAGIRVQGDFDGAAERSSRMVGELTALDRDYGTMIERPPQLDATADMLIETARVMSEDLAAWQDLYGRKRLNLPA
jgi:hypothetical protein